MKDTLQIGQGIERGGRKKNSGKTDKQQRKENRAIGRKK